MPNVSLTPELERFAEDCVRGGRYNNVSEVMRAGLRLLQDAQARRAAFVASLEDAVAQGEREGFVSAEDVLADGEAIIAAAHRREARDRRRRPCRVPVLLTDLD